MTDAEQRWLEARGWIPAKEGGGWHSFGEAMEMERAAFESECRELWRRVYAAEMAIPRHPNDVVFLECSLAAETAINEYRTRFGPQAFESKSVEATQSQEEKS